MDCNWNSADDLAHFREIWEYRSPNHPQMHTRQLWDERAGEWERDLTCDAVKSESTKRRVDATAGYLRRRGLLGPEDDVIDIGCGPGRFVAEFARTCRTATGSDISGRMLELGAAYAESLGLSNTGFVRADFHEADLDELGWRKRFDLVFTSITPAVGGRGSLEKLTQMSRGFCFNSCFVHGEDDLTRDFFAQDLGLPSPDLVAGHWHWFYGLFNLLLLEGYYPEVRYYDDRRSERVPVTPAAAQRLCGQMAPPQGMSREQLSRALYESMQRRADRDGTVPRNSVCTYGWILWDVRRRTVR